MPVAVVHTQCSVTEAQMEVTDAAQAFAGPCLGSWRIATTRTRILRPLHPEPLLKPSFLDDQRQPRISFRWRAVSQHAHPLLVTEPGTNLRCTRDVPLNRVIYQVQNTWPSLCCFRTKERSKYL
jgi:hypothetical protein